MFKFCFVTDRKQLKKGRGLARTVSLAVKNGVDAVMLREKDIQETTRLLELAGKIKKAAGKARFIINGRCDIARAVDADGVHLAANSVTVRQARKILGKTKLIGRSCHSLKDAVSAQKEGADYIFLGPLFYTETKARYGKPLGCAVINKLLKIRGFKIPVIGIGGITPENAPEVLRSRAFGIAVISGISKAGAPGKATASYSKIIKKRCL